MPAPLASKEASSHIAIACPMLVMVSVTRLPCASQANVRVVQTMGAYPTVATMVQDMEARRDLIENLVVRALARLCLLVVGGRVQFRRGSACWR